jgi:hypothetical protein
MQPHPLEQPRSKDRLLRIGGPTGIWRKPTKPVYQLVQWIKLHQVGRVVDI